MKKKKKLTRLDGIIDNSAGNAPIATSLYTPVFLELEYLE